MLGAFSSIVLFFPQLIWLYLNCCLWSKLGLLLLPRELKTWTKSLSASPASQPGLLGLLAKKADPLTSATYCKQGHWKNHPIRLKVLHWQPSQLLNPTSVHRRVLSIQPFHSYESFYIF
eukprot:TRINITY_DN34982_c0_g1_i1.p1 TRINITY_DN34982_c0_g1~~TRINITY_DN34982_c0_g1_i1.p1  ORF type:complete len:119 (+),score=12.37 TRINITY_DN34982_c0_g1_i1:16-372(+)